MTINSITRVLVSTAAVRSYDYVSLRITEKCLYSGVGFFFKLSSLFSGHRQEISMNRTKCCSSRKSDDKHYKLRRYSSVVFVVLFLLGIFAIFYMLVVVFSNRYSR